MVSPPNNKSNLDITSVIYIVTLFITKCKSFFQIFENFFKKLFQSRQKADNTRLYGVINEEWKIENQTEWMRKNTKSK